MPLSAVQTTLIRYKAIRALEDLVPTIELKKKDAFWFGPCEQIERVWKRGDESFERQLRGFARGFTSSGK